MRRGGSRSCPVAEVAADGVGHLQTVQHRIVGEQPAVVGVDAQGRIAAVDRLEQPAKILPDRTRMVRVAVLVGFADRVHGQQPAVFAEGAEQHAVQQLLRGAQHVVPRHVRVVAAQLLEGVLPHVGVAQVELLGQVAADFLRFAQQRSQMAGTGGRHDPLGAQQEHEPPQVVLVVGQPLGVEQLVGVLVAAFVVQPDLADRGDDDPVAGQVDGVAVALVHGRHAAAGEGPVQRIFRAFALQRRDVPGRAVELAQHGVGEFPIDLDVVLAGERVPVRVVGRPGVAQHAVEVQRQEVRKQFLFLEVVGPAGGQQTGPIRQLPAQRFDARRQAERRQVRADHVRTKQGLGFDGQGESLRLTGGRCSAGL